MSQRGTLEERFWRYVTPGQPDECWLWQGLRSSNGYGKIGTSRQEMLYTHRVSWEIHHGPVPDGLFVCHTCDVRLCVNPAHLWLGTAADNLADMHRKGRGHHKGANGVRNGSAHLTEQQVVEIRALYAAGMTQVELAARFGIAQTNISQIVLRKMWKHVP